jgi:polyisoprenoid-binding protein YceI
MKTKFAVLVILFQFAVVAVWAQAFKVDVAKSTLNWKAEKITGSHEGAIGLKSGNLMIQNGKLTSGSFVINMNSITCTDLTDAETNQKFIGHLKSEDFFNVAKFPEAVFAITSPVDVTKSVVSITGNLTIKGITKPLTFKANVIKEGNSYIFSANSIVVDRTAYDIKYGSGSFFDNLGDKAIYDDFLIHLKLVAVQ